MAVPKISKMYPVSNSGKENVNQRKILSLWPYRKNYVINLIMISTMQMLNQLTCYKPNIMKGYRDILKIYKISPGKAPVCAQNVIP